MEKENKKKNRSSQSEVGFAQPCKETCGNFTCNHLPYSPSHISASDSHLCLHVFPSFCFFSSSFLLLFSLFFVVVVFISPCLSPSEMALISAQTDFNPTFFFKLGHRRCILFSQILVGIMDRMSQARQNVC